MMDVVEVPRKALMQYAGEPWAYVVAHCEAGEKDVSLRHVERGGIGQCPKGSAWLRQERDRAFLYFQNW